jgi:hypothetical protein
VKRVFMRLMASHWFWTGAALVVAILLGQSIRAWGLWPAAFAVGVSVAFALGWNRAYNFWRKHGYVSKL